MSSLIFKIFLPVLLGYTLFVLISGRFNLFAKPSELERRPSWMLGSWIGLSVALVTGIVLQTAFLMPLDTVKTLLEPAGLLLAALVVPGLIAYLVYRYVIRTQIRKLEKVDVSSAEFMNSEFERREFDDIVIVGAETDTKDTDIADTAIVLEDQSVMKNADGETLIVFDEPVDTSNNASVSLLFDTVSPSSSNDELNANESNEMVFIDDAEYTADTPLNENTTYVNEGALNGALQKRATPEGSDISSIEEINSLRAEVNQLKKTLEIESSQLHQTEDHLRITRKALKNLEGDTRAFESDKADALIAIESQLESKIKELTAVQAQVLREEESRISAETTVIDIKQELLESKRELRRNTEARAKALATANKTVAFARQSVQARTRAEARITQLENRLKQSQETVSQLIADLDREKAHNSPSASKSPSSAAG